jgi:NAD+ synthase (glutamine-hydrolysing)
VRVALVQTNPIVGDIAGNLMRIRAGLAHARQAGAKLAVFPEQAIIGYPAKDLLLRREVIDGNLAALDALAAETTELAALVGFADRNRQPFGLPLHNSVALLHDGKIAARWHKRLLPIYDVFDEQRYFEPGGPQPVVNLDGLNFGVTVCEDMWSHEQLLGRHLYNTDPIRELADAGARLIFNCSASPFYIGKQAVRIELMRGHTSRNRVPILFCNQVGGNDELLFDGGSCVISADGRVVGQAQAFAEDILLVETDDLGACRVEPRPQDAAEAHDALVMGLRDYVHKCGFKTVVLGLSGGIDSAVIAALAVAALGAENVRAVAMPSRYSSDHSLSDARALADNFGIRCDTVPIEAPHRAFEDLVAPLFENQPPGIAEENIQARARGIILMALSNKFGSLLLTTGNKSELAVGYCTLYGDMAGGLAVISDVPKTMVYRIAEHVNACAGRDVIPRSIITKPPSAELKPDQTDQDSLPPYDVLDAILTRYEEKLQSVDEIIAAGFDADIVQALVKQIHTSEYKRQQAAPGLKVTTRAFGFGRRMPIAARHNW